MISGQFPYHFSIMNLVKSNNVTLFTFAIWYFIIESIFSQVHNIDVTRISVFQIDCSPDKKTEENFINCWDAYNLSKLFIWHSWHFIPLVSSEKRTETPKDMWANKTTSQSWYFCEFFSTKISLLLETFQIVQPKALFSFRHEKVKEYYFWQGLGTISLHFFLSSCMKYFAYSAMWCYYCKTCLTMSSGLIDGYSLTNIA